MNGKVKMKDELIEQYNTRIGLLNAENKRLKKIIMKYERKLTQNYDKTPKSEYNNIALQREIDRLRKLCSDRLGEVEHWKQEYAILSEEIDNPDQCEIVKQKIKKEVAKLIKGFRNDALELHNENEDLLTQNEILKEKLMRYETAVGFRKNEENEALERRYETIVRKLEMERDELEEVIERMQIKMSSMITREFHFEQLRELEIKLLDKLKLKSGSSANTNIMISDLERKVLILKCENDRLQSMNGELLRVQEERVERVEDKAKREVEEQAQQKLEGLEVNINELILENDKLIEENKHLIDKNNYLENEIVKHRRNKYSLNESSIYQDGDRSSMEVRQLRNENQGLNEELKELKLNIKSLKMRQIGYEEKMKDDKLLNDTMEKLERVSNSAKSSKVIVKANFSGGGGPEIFEKRARSNITLVKSGSTEALKESYKLVDKLHVENKMLYSRIRVLEGDNRKRVAENQRLYDIIENKIHLRKIVERERDQLEGRLSEITRSGKKMRGTFSSSITEEGMKSSFMNERSYGGASFEGNKKFENFVKEVREENFIHQSFGGSGRGSDSKNTYSQYDGGKGSQVEMNHSSGESDNNIFASPEKRGGIAQTPKRSSPQTPSNKENNKEQHYVISSTPNLMEPAESDK